MELRIEHNFVPPPANVFEAGESGDVACVGLQRSVALEPMIGEAGEGPAERLLHEVALDVPVSEVEAPHRRLDRRLNRRHLDRVATHERGDLFSSPFLLVHWTRYTGKSRDWNP